MKSFNEFINENNQFLRSIGKNDDVKGEKTFGDLQKGDWFYIYKPADNSISFVKIHIDKPFFVNCYDYNTFCDYCINKGTTEQMIRDEEEFTTRFEGTKLLFSTNLDSAYSLEDKIEHIYVCETDTDTSIVYSIDAAFNLIAKIDKL